MLRGCIEKLPIIWLLISQSGLWGAVHEAILYGEVEEERALTRPAVDRWLFRDDVFSRRLQRTYRTILYAVGRTLYPQEFPEPHRQRGP